MNILKLEANFDRRNLNGAIHQQEGVFVVRTGYNTELCFVPDVGQRDVQDNERDFDIPGRLINAYMPEPLHGRLSGDIAEDGTVTNLIFDYE